MPTYSYSQNSNGNKSLLDRFIPRRAGENFEVSYYNLVTSNAQQHQDDGPWDGYRYQNYAQQNFNKQIYQQRLRDALLPLSNKILNFCASSSTEDDQRKEFVQHWPVKPRKKPEINKPVMILDMPDLDADVCHHFVDWSSKGHLASIFEGNIHIWHPEMSGPYVSVPYITTSNSNMRTCVRWNREGNCYAVGFGVSHFAVIDVTSDKLLYLHKCCENDPCLITSFEWYKEDMLVSGCSKGRVVTWMPKLKSVKSIYRAHKSIIVSMKFSCSDKYFATSCIDGSIKIWLWPDFQEIFEINNFIPSKAFAWHPWRDSLLAIAGGLENAFLSIYNVSTKKEVHRSPPRNGTYIDAITFSSKTGELVISVWYQFKHNMGDCGGKNIIEILSNFTKVTDAIEWHNGKVPYLLWGSEGNQLATAGADENLCIWNFLEKSSLKPKGDASKLKKVYTSNPCRNLGVVSFGHTIR